MTLVVYSVFMKDAFFKCEDEYRIAVVTTQQDSIPSRQFREVNGSFIPYIALPIDLKCVKRIGISPTHKIDFAQRSLTEFATATGVEATIFNSNVPLRY